eukprot:jgi/Ulvmu1/8174/UM040_0071.1
MLNHIAKATVSLAATLLWLQLAAAHVTLRYPLPGLRNDFLDNFRTDDLCGAMPNRGGDGAAWQLPDFNGTIVTTVQAGQPLDVSWDLHYAHQGGFRIELYDGNLTLIHRWNSSDHWGCNVDATVQNVTITLPNQACEGCLLRFERQALEWGGGYLFKSCAVLDITAAPNPCQGCSGHGTCGGGGTCACDSSPATGFFYGTHCEYENECETDAHCGANGKCIDTADESGPAKQCFCEAGFFGDVTTRPSGMQVRTCNRASELTLDTAALEWETFGEEYARSLDASGGTFSAYINPGNDTFEFAMKAQTASWVALGMRSVAAADAVPAAAGGAPAASAEDGAPAAEGEAPAEPAAETEAPSTPSGASATPAAPAAQAEAEGTNRRLLAMRALAESDEPDYEPEAEETPAPAEETATPAEGEAAADDSEASAEAEGDGGDALSTCAALATDGLSVPGALGAGWEVTPAEAADAYSGADGAAAEGEAPAAEGEAPAAAGEAPAAEGEAPSRRRRMHGMPSVEAEAVPGLRRLAPRRALMQAAPAEGATTPAAPAEGAATPAAPAEGAATPAAPAEGAAASEAEDAGAGAEAEGAGAEGEGAAVSGAGTTVEDYTGVLVMPADAVLGDVRGGPCDGYPTTPAGNHAMVNQDVVFGAAREVDGTQYFRVVDMFTPSRAKPLPDSVFCPDGDCGSDDIIDAIGAQIDGRTYIKFVRNNVPADLNKATDVCLSNDQNYHVVYAYGQLTASATHEPSSSLEVLPADEIANKDFYKEDVLKFHGGGIGVQFEGRGTLSSSANLFEDDTAAAGGGGGACNPSTEEGFTCSLSRLGGQVIVHYTPFQAGDTAATLAVETPAEGWVAFAFAGDDPTSMVGATAVIATTDAANGQAGVFNLNGRSVDGVEEVPGAATLTAGRRRLSQAAISVYDVEVERAGGRTLLKFTRDVDDTFDAAGQIEALVAHHSSPGLATHTGREPLAFALSSDGTVTDIVDPVEKHRRTHAILMILGWGLLLPLGVMLANTLRTLGPIWFQLHRLIQVIGLAIATGGVILALVKFDSLEDDHKHRRLGLTVMILGWLQPLNALIRPHPPKDDERKSALRWGWEILHKGVGYLTLILAIVTIFWGLELAETFGGLKEDHDTYRRTYIGILIALGVLWASLLVFHFINKRRKCKDKASSDGSGGVQKPLEEAPSGGQYVVSANPTTV